MLTVRINYRNLVRQLLPAHKRQPVRLWWLRGLVSPLSGLFGDFDRWRSNTRMLVNVSSQVAVFEGYLKRKYNEPIAIRVSTFNDGALMVALEVEGQGVDIALHREMNPAVAVALQGEVREQFGDADFIVYIPAGIDAEEIRAEIERFKLAQMRYRIVQR